MSADYLLVAADTLLRQQPSLRAPVIEIIPTETELEVERRLQGWVQVRYGSLSGWILTEGGGELVGLELPLTHQEQALDEYRLAQLKLFLDKPVDQRLGPYPLYTDVSNREFLDHSSRVATELERLYPLLFGVEPGQTGPGVIALFADRDTVAAYLSEVGTSVDLSHLGLSARLNQARCCGVLISAMPIGGLDGHQGDQILIHELTHLLTRRAFKVELPDWLEEGLAEALAYSYVASDGRIEPRRLGGTSVIGDAKTRSLGARASLERLIALWSVVEPLARKDGVFGPSLPRLTTYRAGQWSQLKRWDLFQAKSGFLVRFLLFGKDGRYSDGFRTFLLRIQQGGDNRAEPWSELGLTAGQVEDQFYAWLRSRAQAHGLQVPGT